MYFIKNFSDMKVYGDEYVATADNHGNIYFWNIE